MTALLISLRILVQSGRKHITEGEVDNSNRAETEELLHVRDFLSHWIGIGAGIHRSGHNEENRFSPNCRLYAGRSGLEVLWYTEP